MKYYILIPIDEITRDMIIEDTKDRLGRLPSEEDIKLTMKYLRTVIDNGINPPIEFGILKFNNRFNNVVAGYKKYTAEELRTELSGAEFLHNQGP